jgi:hypothetical protein
MALLGDSGSIKISASAQHAQDEKLSFNSAELIAYLSKAIKSDQAKVALSSSDSVLVRVLEDLINTLIDKKVIVFTDLPFVARGKLSSREKIRGHLNSLENLMGSDEAIL